MRIFDLSLGQMLWSRRSVFLGLVLGGPVLLAAAVRLIIEMNARGFRINGAAATGSAVFGLMIWLLYIRFIIPILGVLARKSAVQGRGAGHGGARDCHADEHRQR